MKTAVPILTEVIRDRDNEDKTNAATLLARIGPGAKAAIPDLIAMLADERFGVRFEAALALTAIESKAAKSAVGVLIEGTKSTNNYQQHQSAKALAKIGPPANAAIPALEALFNAKYIHSRYSAAEAVAQIEPAKTEASVKVICGILNEKKTQSSMVRTYCLQALRRIGPAAKSAVPTLHELLNDDGAFHGEVAITAVCLAGKEAAQASKFIHDCLVSEKANDDAYEIAEFLPLLGKKATLFMPEMRVALENAKNDYFQEQLCEAIAGLGPDGKEFEPLLRSLKAKTKRKSTIQAIDKALTAIAAK